MPRNYLGTSVTPSFKTVGFTSLVQPFFVNASSFGHVWPPLDTTFLAFHKLNKNIDSSLNRQLGMGIRLPTKVSTFEK